MKLVFDEHMPPSLVDALALLSRGEGHELHHVRKLYGPGVADADWLLAAGADGAAVITCDHRILTRPHEAAALRAAGVIAFVLPKAFNQMGFWDQAAFVARWWPALIRAAEAARPGDLFPIPHKWAPRPLERRRRP